MWKAFEGGLGESDRASAPMLWRESQPTQAKRWKDDLWSKPRMFLDDLQRVVPFGGTEVQPKETFDVSKTNKHFTLKLSLLRLFKIAQGSLQVIQRMRCSLVQAQNA